MIHTCLNNIEYANRCDVAITRRDAIPFLKKQTSINDITDNCKIYCWSTLLPSLFEFLNKNNFKNITLLSGDNDHSANPNGCVTSFPGENNVCIYIPSPPRCIVKWYAQNAQVSNNFIVPLPIGLTPPWVAENKIYNAESLKKVLKNEERTNLINCSFNLSTNPTQRQEIKNIILNNMGVDNSIINPSEYYSALQKTKYAICPPGNGKDTHRVWECLYLGTVPIVEDSPMNRQFAKIFPILVIERWSDITEKLLINSYDRLANKFKNLNLLDVDEWFKSQGL